MFKRNIFVLIMLASSFLLALPLSADAATSEPLLLVDFSSLLQATSMDTKIDAQLKEAGQRLESQLKQAAKDMNTQLKDAQEKAGKKPSLKQQKELNQLATISRERMINLKQNANTELLQLRANIFKQLRDQIKPIAEKIAHQRGAKAVMLVDQSMLWFDHGVDITADVLAKVRAHPLTLKPLPPVKSSEAGKAKDAGDIKK